jgi:SulP family sulfate permease
MALRLLSPQLEPKLVTVFREGYTWRAFARDALAGVVVGIVALPLAIAFAIASGVRPEQGIYTAVVAGFLISVFGGSRVQIGGPTGAFVVIIAGIVGKFGYDGLAVATLMAGAMLVVMAFARLGDVIRFIPYPVTIGFTSGIALIIATGQIGDGLGLALSSPPAHFWGRCAAYAQRIGSTNAAAAGLCAGTIVLVRLWPRVTARVPGPLVALLAATAATHAFGLRVDTIGSRFGSVPSGLPMPRLPHVDWAMVPDLVSPAISIALLAGIESLLSALVADGLTGGRHRSNAELLGQGIANLASPLFGGIPATGAIARTATNVKNGGRTPVAGIVHAATLLLILLVAGRWAALIPMASLAGILLVVAYNMSEWHVFARLLRGPRSDVLVLLTTFLLTVLVDLVIAIQVGVVLAALLLMRRMAQVTQVRALPGLLDYDDSAPTKAAPPLPPGVEAFEIMGSFCFGAARKFTETLAASMSRPRVVILRMRHVLAIDATGLQALEDVAARLKGRGATLLLTGVQAQPLAALEKSGTLDRIGRANLHPTLHEAVKNVSDTLLPG